MIDFTNSTHYRDWFFKDQPEKLHKIGEAKYQRFHGQLTEYFKEV